MKTVVQINTCDYGSTGKIMLDLAETIRQQGDRCFVVVPNGRHNPWKNKPGYIKFGNRLAEDFHILMGYLTGFQGCFSFFSTLHLIRKLKKIKPDIIHLHNLHNCYINLPLLFGFIKKQNIRVVWTLHDCWAFTGKCPYFTFLNCNKWKTGCFACPAVKQYPQSIADQTEKMFLLKKKIFCGVPDLVLVTPSEWLAGLVKQSFLKEYPVQVINNGIDLNIFKPTLSKFREKYSIADTQKIILAVAFDWGLRKGLDVVVGLSEKLDKKKYMIVLVGTTEYIDKEIPSCIISIHRTRNRTELAEIYSAADVVINPTREDNYPTVNLEALACGTPVITFNTGGCPEIIDDSCGIVLTENSVEAMAEAVEKICEDSLRYRQSCLNRAESFGYAEKYTQYLKLYNMDQGF